jgi:predicted small metal-binding protein
MDKPAASDKYLHETAVIQNIRNHAGTAHKMHVLSADVIFKVQNPINTFNIHDEPRE